MDGLDLLLQLVQFLLVGAVALLSQLLLDGLHLFPHHVFPLVPVQVFPDGVEQVLLDDHYVGFVVQNGGQTLQTQVVGVLLQQFLLLLVGEHGVLSDEAEQLVRFLLLHHPDQHVFVHLGHILGVVLKQGLHQPDGGFHPLLLHLAGVNGGGTVVGLQKGLFRPVFP